MKPFLVVLLVSVAILCASPMVAHHGPFMYDLERTITVRGHIAEVRWANPHVEILIQGEDETGAEVQWLFESLPPFQLEREGLSVTDFGLQREVEIEGYPAREPGRISAWARSIRIEDGPAQRLLEQGKFTRIPQ